MGEEDLSAGNLGVHQRSERGSRGWGKERVRCYVKGHGGGGQSIKRFEMKGEVLNLTIEESAKREMLDEKFMPGLRGAKEDQRRWLVKQLRSPLNRGEYQVPILERG